MPFDGKDFTLPAVVTDEVLRLLVAARALLSNPNHWAQGAYCKGDAYCMAGALGFNDAGNVSDDIVDAGKYLTAFTPFGSVPTFNDHRKTTHSDVLSVFDRAIAARRGELS
jgi:hypothetical protein